jgi:hypothetical protein
MYIKNGDIFWPTSEANLDIHKTLGNGVYEVKVHPDRGFFFQQAPEFKIPSKLYGDIDDVSHRIINTYVNREGTTGVLLDGLKGSGKTMLAKLVSARAAESLNIPTILIGAAYKGPSFISLLRDLPRSVIIFDEFEKIYDMGEGDQNELLSLFDGVFTSHSLILVTCNDSYQISDFFKNRPGRILYNLKFDGLDQRFVREYCNDRLENTANIEQVLEITGFAGNYSFDMLQALIEEMNRYKETAKASLKFLNFETAHRDLLFFQIKLTFKGSSYECHTIRGLPLLQERITVKVKDVPSNFFESNSAVRGVKKVSDEGDSPTKYLAVSTSTAEMNVDELDDEPKPGTFLVLTQAMLINKDSTNKTYTYRHPNGAVVVFTPREEAAYSYLDLL